MITKLQKQTAQSIVNIFETGRALGDYGSVTLLKGDTGHLTYGRSQTTLASGNLALLLHAYCEAGGALSDALKPYLSAFDKRDVKLDANAKVKGLLRQAGSDPVMMSVQDGFFDRVYWEPALKWANATGVTKPLGVAVVYDSRIHGSYIRMKDRTEKNHGKVEDIGEENWIKAYVSVRRSWLANHSNKLLNKTVYRMDAFNALIDAGKWELELPLTVRNVVISEELFKKAYARPVIVSAADENERVLFLATPMMRGDDVKRLQRALGLTGKAVDGKFGSDTDKAVREFQKKHGLKVDGKVGNATRAELGI